MRDPGKIKREIAAGAAAMATWEGRVGELRTALARLLVEARDHPELTLEEARKAPEREIPRQTANRMIKEVERWVTRESV